MVDSISEMEVRILSYGDDSKGCGFVRHTMRCSSSEDLQKLRGSGSPLVYVISMDCLPRLRNFSPPIIDRGIKNKHKGLSEYLMGTREDRIPLIDGNYGSSRQLERSIRTFIINAKNRREDRLFLIGIKNAIFDKLWHDAGESFSKGRRRQDRPYPDIDSADEMASVLLRDLWQRCNVPPELERRFVGSSWKVDLVRRFIILAAGSDTPVLILGDTGTGKEIVARSIHEIGRKGTPFKALNCGGIPDNLFESELFGYKKGSFTGALEDRAGLWEEAKGGTLFLDEIGDLPLLQQVKILRALEDRKIRRLGETTYRPVETRVIAASNRDLSSMTKMGQFREDLYYRLRGIPIHTPALKDHPDDIPLLAEHFWEKITTDIRGVRMQHSPKLSRRVLDELRAYRWPGNARELKMVLNNLYTICGPKEIKERDLRSVFYLQGQDWTTGSFHLSERGIDLLRGDCWRHLRRADDVIRTMRYELTPILGSRKIDNKALASARANLDFHLGELEILCQEHMLFHTDKTYSAVLGFRDRLRDFHDLFQSDIHRAKKYWNETLAADFEAVLTVIFREAERVLGTR